MTEQSFWASILYTEGAAATWTTQPALGELVTKRGELRFYSRGGPSYMCLYPDHYKIVKQYPVVRLPGEQDDEEAIKRIEILFTRDHPMHPGPFQPVPERSPISGEDVICIEGWLSPSGHYYHHATGEHQGVGDWLARQLFSDMHGSDYLYATGWLTIHQNGRIRMREKVLPNPAQIAFLKTMMKTLEQANQDLLPDAEIVLFNLGRIVARA